MELGTILIAKKRTEKKPRSSTTAEKNTPRVESLFPILYMHLRSPHLYPGSDLNLAHETRAAARRNNETILQSRRNLFCISPKLWQSLSIFFSTRAWIIR